MILINIKSRYILFFFQFFIQLNIILCIAYMSNNHNNCWIKPAVVRLGFVKKIRLACNMNKDASEILNIGTHPITHINDEISKYNSKK